MKKRMSKSYMTDIECEELRADGLSIPISLHFHHNLGALSEGQDKPLWFTYKRRLTASFKGFFDLKN
ncbi:hypothetical protein ABID23_000318 [Bartonella silvatica]|uniref:Uncharacterized protein n=1 Tax=Bartonella silvatica TaxID=357760 RepID=A0ABV2HFD5_9HYPH